MRETCSTVGRQYQGTLPQNSGCWPTSNLQIFDSSRKEIMIGFA